MKLEKAGTVDFKKSPRGRFGQAVGRRGPKVRGRFAGVPQTLEFVAFCDSGNIFQLFSRNFPGVFLENPRTDPGNNHSLLEFFLVFFSEFGEPAPQIPVVS